MGHDEKEVINVASETAHVRVCRHLVVGLRSFTYLIKEEPELSFRFFSKSQIFHVAFT